MKKQEFEKVLIDVRKSYRLLYLYQQRVLDLANFIGNKLSFSFEGGYSKFSSSIPNGNKVKLNRYSWDWLPMYLYEFHFGLKEVHSNEIHFSLILQSDTGFHDSNLRDRLDLENFSEADNCKSRLILVAAKNVDWGCPIQNLLKEMNRNKEIFEFKDNESIWFGKAYDLVNFIDETSTNIQLLDFIAECNNRNINIMQGEKLK